VIVEEKIEMDGEGPRGLRPRARVRLTRTDGAMTLPEYQAKLQFLLDDRGVRLSTEEISSLRAIVRRRRNGHASAKTPRAAPHVCARADEIVALLMAAARELRPRETQELDDLVAGKLPKTQPTPNAPVRMHRSGWPSR
jgi:hypothetical protein